MFKIFVLLITLFFTTSCADQDQTKKPVNTNSQEETMQEEDKFNYVKLEPDSTFIAVFETNMGDFEIELFANETPKTVTNFVTLAKENFYDSVTFHRVIDGFMIQGGDPTGSGMGGKSIYDGKPFEDEFVSSLRHDAPGILSMANRGPNTNTSQFFITLVPTPHLNDRHTVFGRVISGMDVVYSIGKVETEPPHNKPVEPVVMEKVSIEKRAAESK